MKPREIVFRKFPNGFVRVGLMTPRGRQWVSTGQTTYPAARAVCDEAKIQELQFAAQSNVLTHEVIARLLVGRRMTCADILAAWKSELAQDIAPDTLAAYETHLSQFLEECDYARQPLSAVRRNTISAWVNCRGVAVGSRRARLAALRSFYKFASSAGYCVGNPAARVMVRMRDLLFPEIESKETKPITPEEYALLMASPRVTGFWRAAIPLGYYMALRLRDVACLEWASITPDHVIFYPRKSMRNGTAKRLALPINDPLLGGGELRKTVLEMMEAPATDPQFCFPQMRAVALDPQKRAALSVQFQRLLQAHRITGRRFHSLRHACAMRLDAAGKTLEEIGSVLGHSSLETTRIYTNHDNR